MKEDNGKRDDALKALSGLRTLLRQVASRVRGFDHVHRLLHGMDVDLGRASDVLASSGGADLLDRVRLLIQEADEGQFPVEGELTAGMVSDMVLAAREASIKLSAFLGDVT